MATEVRILLDHAEIVAHLDDTPTAAAIRNALPLEGTVNRWGEEIYFTIPVHVDEASSARQEMEVGDLGYWPVGAAFCIFFGPTPVSTGTLPRAYSNVNPFGRLGGDQDAAITALSETRDGEVIRVVAA